MIWRFRLIAAGLLLTTTQALGSVAQVALLQGSAHRSPIGGSPVALRAGGAVELGDTLEVSSPGNLKLLLSDSSVLMLAGGSKLYIDQAEFENQERKSFSAKLLIGSLWAKVTKVLAGSNAKFEVTTDRAVAGVRGTIFRVDALKSIKGVKPKAGQTIVGVTEGKVGVEAQIKKPRPKGGPSAEPRVEVAGPKEVSKEEWEKKFVELQANQQVTVGEELWTEAVLSPSAKKDGFAKFIGANQ